MIGLFEQTFSRFPAILPVIHVESYDQALRNVNVARQQGCHGVFLINHDLPYERLLAIHHQVFKQHPDWWIGVNCLGLAPRQLFGKLSVEVAGLWVDNAQIDEREEEQRPAELIAEARERSGWPGLYFGGVAFKYQRPVAELARAAVLASHYMDVVTTSGPGTAQAASLDKIRTFKNALGRFPLAIASGITPANVADYVDISDCFLVASGISKSRTELAPQLLSNLVNQIQPAQRQQLAGYLSYLRRQCLQRNNP